MLFQEHVMQPRLAPTLHPHSMRHVYRHQFYSDPPHSPSDLPATVADGPRFKVLRKQLSCRLP